MSQINMSLLWSNAKQTLRNAPIVIVGLGVIAGLEVYSAGAIFQTVTGTVSILGVMVSLALIQTIVSLGCSLLSWMGNVAVEVFKADPRGDQKNRALGARVLSLLLSLVPIWFLGGAFAEQIGIADAAQFRASAAYSSYYQLAHAPPGTADSDAIKSAAVELERGDAPKSEPFNPLALFGAAFLYGCVLSAAGVFWKAPPETAEEATRREARLAEEAEALKRSDAAKKGAATRKANEAKRRRGEANIGRFKAPNVTELVRKG